MIKKSKHILGYLIEKSNRKRTSEAEENVLNDFMHSEYKTPEWDTPTMGNKEQVSQKIYAGILKHIDQKERPVYYLRYIAAASILLLLGLGILLKPKAGTVEKMLTFTTMQAPDSLKLGDGSTIYLAAHSKFYYPTQFTGATRKVQLLQGNAFFNVAKDAQHPFIITSGQLETKVLGTSFHIQLSGKQCHVAVVTGKVNVSTATASIDLIPGEEASFEAEKLTRQKADKALLNNWYKQDITLNNVPLEEVFSLLHYKYGVNFQLANTTIPDTRVTVFVAQKASLESILQQINYITYLKFETYGNTVKVN